MGQEVFTTSIALELLVSLKNLIRFCLTSGEEEQECKMEKRGKKISKSTMVEK